MVEVATFQLLADMMYQRNEGEEAMKHFAQLLERNPSDCIQKSKHKSHTPPPEDHYHALARYIELGWRQGSIEMGERMLRNALESNPRATVDAGFNFCKGLIEWSGKGRQRCQEAQTNLPPPDSRDPNSTLITSLIDPCFWSSINIYLLEVIQGSQPMPNPIAHPSGTPASPTRPCRPSTEHAGFVVNERLMSGIRRILNIF